MIHYVHSPEFDRYYGRSDLREAYRAWFCKDVLLKIWAAVSRAHGRRVRGAEPIRKNHGITSGTAEYVRCRRF
jgi:hypothetical protein